MINLREIDAGNWRKLARLKVLDSQASFVASNSVSMAQAHYEMGNYPLGIFDVDVPVGFCMYGIDYKENEHWVVRLMIDARFQSKGFGKRAMELLIERMHNQFGKGAIYLSFEPENEWAKALYESLGFMPDGRIIDGEIVYKLESAD